MGCGRPRPMRERSLGYSLPISLGAFLREFFAVSLILTLQQRAWAYDFFAPGLVLFLLLIALRIPYINTFAVLFEWLAMGEWDIRHHVGIQRHRTGAQNLVHVFALVLAHVSASGCAAALRVYLDVTFGRELGGAPAPRLGVQLAELAAVDPFWNAEPRIDRLLRMGYNTSAVAALPLGDGADLGIDRLALIAWYAGEEVGFVALLCVCFAHIWMASGVADGRAAASNNPFAPTYWRKLFTVCVLLTAIYTALFRAFPSAHGSIHVTIFRCYYQQWSPTVRLVDLDNHEPLVRIVGGFVGLFLACVYNRVLVNTEAADDNDESTDFMFKLIWGMEPDCAHSKKRRVEEGGADWPKRRRVRQGLNLPPGLAKTGRSGGTYWEVECGDG